MSKNVTFVDNSKAILTQMQQIELKWLEMAAMIIEGSAVALCAVDTGRLRDNIDYKVSKSEMAAYVGTNVEYAIYIEFGTGEFAENGNGRKGGWAYPKPDGSGWVFTLGMRPQPFIRPAFRNNKQKIQKLLKQLYGELGS